MLDDAGKRLRGVWHRQQVVEESGVMRRPGQVFREQTGLVSFDELLEALKMLLI